MPLLLSLLALVSLQSAEVLDDFTTLANWKAIHAEGVNEVMGTERGQRGQALRMDFDYNGQGGYALAERTFDRKLPANFEFSFWLKAETPDNNFELKLADPSGQNVWWFQRAAFHWPKQWTHMVIRKRQIKFAWGPTPGDLSQVGTLQFGIAANAGGKGTVWIEDLRFRELPELGPFTGNFEATVDQQPVLGGHPWKTQANEATVDLNLGKPFEVGGLVMDWSKQSSPTSVVVQTSADNGQHWDTAKRAENALPGKQIIFTAGASGPLLRLLVRSTHGIELKALKVLPVEASESSNAMLQSIAAESPRGLYTRHLLKEQCYWTIVGSNGGTNEGLLSEDGQIELGKAMPSIDPFIRTETGTLYSWNNSDQRVALEDGYLPLPMVTRMDPVRLEISAFTANDATENLYGTYKLTNPTRKRWSGNLILALHPVQVNPVWQSLNYAGGHAAIQSLVATPTSFIFNGNHRINFLRPANRAVATPLSQGEISAYLNAGILPLTTSAEDPQGFASGAMVYQVHLAPGQSQSFAWRYEPHGVAGANTVPAVERLRKETAQSWKRLLSAIKIELPADQQRVIDVVRSNVAYMLINRDGAELHPGSRNYARAWIRDGSLMSAALLHFGRAAEVKAFLDYYSKFIRPDGYVPCIVDKRGADPVPENDSHGEFIYLAAEYYRFTKDKATLHRLYPILSKVAHFIESDIVSNEKPEYLSTNGIERSFYGLISPSISHEGYAQPKHSYWDDFMALKGLKDMVEVAQVEGDQEAVKHYEASADHFRKNLNVSLEFAAQFHHINYLPGCAELGDFDATSTSIGISPSGEIHNLPPSLLHGTFERYWQFCNDRITGKNDWKDYTPYELRTLSTFIRLGQRSRAQSIISFFMNDIRPQGFNHWAEVVHRNYREPKFIGDMPHTWCAAEFLRSFRDFFVYEQELDHSIVLAGGVPESYLFGKGMKALDLPTAYGNLSLVGRISGGVDRFVVSGQAKAPGGIWVTGPRDSVAKRVRVNGKYVNPARQIKVSVLPSSVEFVY